MAHGTSHCCAVCAPYGSLIGRLSLFDAAARAEPDSVKVLNNLAMHLMNHDAAARARAARLLRRSLRLLPDYASGHFNIGLVYMLQGQRARAIRHLRASLAVDKFGSGGKVHAYLGRELAAAHKAWKGAGGVGGEALLHEAVDRLHEARQRGCSATFATFELANLYGMEVPVRKFCGTRT